MKHYRGYARLVRALRIVIGVVSTAGGIVAGAAVIVYAAGMYIQSAKWSGWQNSIAHFAYLIGKFRTNPGRGGGF